MLIEGAPHFNDLETIDRGFPPLYPNRMMELTPYPSFSGNCEEAFDFYAQCLPGKIETIVRFAGSPMADRAGADWQEKIMHARLSYPGGLLMGSDQTPDRYEPTQGIQISIGVDEVAEAERIFASLSAGGEIEMPLEETFWAARFGMFKDRFGIPWTVNCETKP